MARSPDVLIFARHGARLDAADKTWHLTSPAPYDPPLTYGGWNQARALGTRIASFLNAREKAQDAEGSDNSGSGSPQLDGVAGSKAGVGVRKRKRGHKVVIHSSPFLRCVQTSIGIGAGLAQFREQAESTSAKAPPPKAASTHSVKPFHSSGLSESSELTSVSEPDEQRASKKARKQAGHPQMPKAALRVDAFLGEWLSPDYFEDITPPPGSTLMVAGAKAELLRHSDYDNVAQTTVNRSGNFPGGWNRGAPDVEARPSTSDGDPLTSIAALNHALPRRERSESYSSVGSAGSKSGKKGRGALSEALKASEVFYKPPVPAYAISPSEPIPRGYVAHARDACIDVDYNWDSMREPHSWGDGGEYGEEWSSMHKRFRRGLQSMVNWYKGHNADVTGFEEDSLAVPEEEDDSDKELVLILVTHGAGCNALIGGITNQPVLLDVGMASLTLAVRKSAAERNSPPLHRRPSPSDRRRTSIDIGLSSEYDTKLVASTEHLRSDPSKAPSAESPKTLPRIPEYRRRNNSSATQVEPRAISAALGSMRRGSSAAPPGKLFSATPQNGSTASSTTTTGLWSRTPASPTSLDGFSDFSGQSGTASPLTLAASPKLLGGSPKIMPQELDEDETIAPLPPSLGRSMSQHGLWGAPPSGSRNERKPGPKRRWTINEND